MESIAIDVFLLESLTKPSKQSCVGQRRDEVMGLSGADCLTDGWFV